MDILIPPQNQAGIPVPANPQVPPTLDDIAQADDYLRALRLTRDQAAPSAVPPNLPPAPAPAPEATVPEILQATEYQWRLNAAAHYAGVPPAWAQQLLDSLATLDAELSQVIPRAMEPLVRSANRRAKLNGKLFDSTQAREHGWVEMERPNPRSRGELRKFTARQCQASAEALGLPPMPDGSSVRERRKQIASRIGIVDLR